ncbi:MAG: ATP-dependent DNA helicase RecG [Deltaproteobacteria bacterium]|nr:ATP-dependent DNA helicase RecG [Deltaproteobacteria bacterium]
MSITQVKGIGPKLGAIFKKKGLETVEDVLYWLPIRYEDRRQIKKISLLRIGTKEVASGEIMAMGEVFYGRRKVFEISMGDGSGFLRLKWFHYRLPLIKKRYKIGQRLVVYGEIGSFGGQKEIIHPDVEIFEKGEEVDSINFNAIVPVYSQIGNMHQKTLRKIIRNIVDDYSSLSVGSVPSDIQKRYGLLELPAAMSEVHTPSKIPSCPSLEKGGRRDLNSRDWLPKKSLVFDELFCLEIGLALKKRSVCREDGIAFKVGVNFKSAAMVEKLLSMLPFKLTAAQERVVSEIKMDMSEPHPMNRLIQGDVGSGKTVVAFIASLIAIENNYQSAIMAPTEILAEQHYLNIHRYADVLGIKIALLTSSFAKSEKMGILNHIKAGEADLVIGTHALIQEDVEFKKLGLVIVDEQHRFGVVQRALLKNKGARGKPACAWPHSDRGQGTEKELTPDVLVMTATPIPRTLAMTVFGDLDVSVIDELPPGRRPIKTKVFREKEREQVYKIIRGELVKGRQSYIVYPLIEESEELDLRDATKMAEHMKKDIFSEYNIGLLHGRMKPDEKEAVMKAFKAKEINILVSTTVIEVGIDVPNASVMVIEHAERFGLSQLHQLRGRVGRGGYDSFCILLAGRVGSEDTYKRLKVMENTNDGFKIAEEDLNIRGPGDFLGTRQSGLPDFRIANLLTDASILQKARDEAFNLLRNDPDLIKQEHNALKQIVKVRWNGKMELSQIG